MDQNVDQRAAQLSLPHVEIEVKTLIRYAAINTPCSKYKLVVSIYSTTEASLAMSTLAVWCRVVRYRDFSVHPIR